MKNVLFLILVLAWFASPSALQAQTNVRAWYAEGQVWVVWEVGFPLPETYAIYAKPTAFDNTADAVLVGRPFKFEYGAAALKEQLVDTFATYRIPDGQGGTYQLALNEGLFVATPHQAGELFFAVVPWGEATVTPGVNITDSAVPFSFSPFDDPVECHLQASFPSPFSSGFTCFAYILWVDGRQDYWDARPDFPIMANEAKNGMPGLFFVSVPNDIDTTQPFPLTVWLHGGEGDARQSLAGSRPIVGIDPVEGILLSHNDDLAGWRDNVQPNINSPSWHFGYRKNWDPFNPGNLPTGTDTVVNYTQRRYIWVDQWLARHFNIDTTRININGHSMGGAGTTALAKCYPEHYASATIFNNGFGGPANDQSVALFGSNADDFKTNLTTLANNTYSPVPFFHLWNITDRCSIERDWPPMRCYHSKSDSNNTMQWDDFVVENYRKADSLGMGVQLYWSERDHGIDTGPDFNDHWHNGNNPDQQTGYDNTAYEEDHFRSNLSFPAFSNLRLDPAAQDPGDGTQGVGSNGVGDDWGTWGGYHRWEDVYSFNSVAPSVIIIKWEAVVWLEDNAVFTNDNCPVDELVSDLVIRKAKPFICTGCSTPELYLASSVSLANDGYFKNVSAEINQTDTTLIIKDVSVFREGIRKIKIEVDLIVATASLGPTPFTAALQPNPVPEATTLFLQLQMPSELDLRIHDAGGRQVRSLRLAGQAGENQVPLALDDLPSGLYFLEIRDMLGNTAVLKLLKT